MSTSGRCIHHVAFGVVLVMISGLTLVTLSVDVQKFEFTMAASIFRVRATLVLDSTDPAICPMSTGRKTDASVDAVFAAVAVAGLLIMGLTR